MEEILHQLIASLSHYLQGFVSFVHTRWCRISSINSSLDDVFIFGVVEISDDSFILAYNPPK